MWRHSKFSLFSRRDRCENSSINDQVRTFQFKVLTACISLSMEPAKKKLKTSYNPDWEQLYLCCQVEEEVFCLLCDTKFTCLKSCNIQRHYTSKHVGFTADYPLKSEKRSTKILDLKAKKRLTSRCKVWCRGDIKTASRISLEIAHELTVNKKALGDGEIFKDMFARTIINMFRDTELEQRVTEFAENLPLSRRTIARRVELISENLRAQLIADLVRCDYFSVQLDESTDRSKHAQLAIFFRMVFKDLEVREEFFTLAPIKKRATGEEIFQAVNREFLAAQVTWEKIAGITTDRAANMTGIRNGL